jgi:hypothetical protein
MPATGSVRYATVLALLPVTACLGGPHMVSERDEAVPVPHHATWAWAAPDTSGDWERDPALASEITEQRFRRAFDSVLTDLHFEHIADADEADFTFSYHIGVRRTNQGTAPAGHSSVAFGVMIGGAPGYGWGPGFGPPVYGPARGYPYRQPGWGWGWGAGYYSWPGWGWGAYGPPIYAGSVLMTRQAQYGMGALVAVLRSTNNGDVAWEGTYLLDPYEMQNVTQRHVHDIVTRLMSKLR